MGGALVLNPLSQDLPDEKPFAVFDIEAEPAYPGEPLNTKFLCANVYDGTAHIECPTERELVDCLMADRFHDHWLYAHNGSGYDFLFIFRELNRRKASFRAFRTGGRYFLKINGRSLFDSAAILRSSLAQICEDLKIERPKMKVPEDFYERIRHYWPIFGQEYMRRDCEALYDAIRIVRDTMRKLGCVLKPTLASTAMDLFRRKYLARPLYPEPWDSPVEAAARSAYTGGRVEVFKPKMRAGGSWDINSCFPRAMLDPVPVELDGAYRSGIPDFGLVDCEINVPREEYAPPIAWRSPSGKLFFPTGSWRAWVTAIEARAMVDRYGANSIRIHQNYSFVGEAIFHGYCTDLFDVRLAAKRRKDASMAYVCKLVLNCLYGKLATARTREEMLFGEQYLAFPFDSPGALKKLAKLKELAKKNPSIKYSVREYSSEDHIYGMPTFLERAPYIFPAAAAWITSHARVLQLQPLLDAAGSDLVYCDTDSIYQECDAPATLYTDKLGDKLGELKLESHIKRGEFVAPKCYWYERAKGTYEKPEDRYEGAAKGLPRKSFEVMKAFLTGERVPVPRMYGALESLARDGLIAPKSEVQHKGMLEVEKKRAPEGRAWTVAELLEKKRN